jgi:rubrerythrin
MSTTHRYRLWTYLYNLFQHELKDSSPKYAQPAHIKQPLLAHQQTTLNKVMMLEAAKREGISCEPLLGDPYGGILYANYGIIADPVGSGKSLTALALAGMPRPSEETVEILSRNNTGNFSDLSLMRTRTIMSNPEGGLYKAVNASLFIIPHALMSQWETYVTRDTSLKCFFIKKTKDAITPILPKLEEYQCFFVSSTMWKHFEESNPLSGWVWNRIFVDEADTIGFTNRGGIDTLKACYYWFITASWINLAFPNGMYISTMNSYPPPPMLPTESIEFIKKTLGNGTNGINIRGITHANLVRTLCIFGISPYCSGSGMNAVVQQSFRLFVRNSPEFLAASLRMPTVRHISIICETPPSLRVHDSSISPAMIERIHAGDLNGVIEMLGLETHSVSTINDALTLSLKKDLEQAQKVYDFKKTIEYSSDAAKRISFETCEKKIASLASRISAIEERLKTVKEQTCPICCGEIEKPAVTPCCQNVFCFGCICRSLTRASTCPLCRARIHSVKELNVIGEDATAPSPPPAPKKFKNDALLSFLKENPTAHVLMFSGYDATFTSLQHILRTADISHAVVHGSNAHINKLLREFEAGKYRVLFLNAHNMGAGLNISAASHVVLYHRMSPAVEHQIVGRAYRLGRTAPLDVVHLLHTTEVDTERSSVLTHA